MAPADGRTTFATRCSTAITSSCRTARAAHDEHHARSARDHPGGPRCVDSDVTWENAPDAPAMAEPDVVDVWAVRSSLPAYIDVLLHTLSDDELSAPIDFTSTATGAAYICARGALRHLLSRYLDAEARGPRRSATVRTASPRCRADFEGALTFNVSHSDELALIAIGRDIETGRRRRGGARDRRRGRTSRRGSSRRAKPSAFASLPDDRSAPMRSSRAGRERRRI